MLLIILLNRGLSLVCVNFNLFVPVWSWCFKSLVNCIHRGQFDIYFSTYWRRASIVGWKIGVMSFCWVLSFYGSLWLLFLNLFPQNTFHQLAVLFTQSSSQISTLWLLSFNCLLKLKQFFSCWTCITLWMLHSANTKICMFLCDGFEMCIFSVCFSF